MHSARLVLDVDARLAPGSYRPRRVSAPCYKRTGSLAEVATLPGDSKCVAAEH
jgi:hypothetical protein